MVVSRLFTAIGLAPISHRCVPIC